LAYQPPANSTFLSQQTSQQYFFSQNKSAPAISHQPNEQADGRGEERSNQSKEKAFDLMLPNPVPSAVV
jgi:hypothetical protein